jgi:hypothetical protein
MSLAENDETFDAIYDSIIHSELAKKLHVQDLRELHLTYLMLANTFRRNGLVTLH